MLKKKQLIKGVVSDFTNSGLGIIKYQQDTVLVKDVFINEEVEVLVDKKVKEGYYGNVVKFIKSSSMRDKVRCPYFKLCGSCNYLYKLYPFELKDKKQEIEKVLKKERLNINVKDVCGMEIPFAYRNKCIITFAYDKKMKAGFYSANSHNVVNIDNCLLHDEKTNQLIKSLKQTVSKCHIEVYDEHSGRGFLKHIQIRRAIVTDETMVTLVTNEKNFRGKKNFISTLLKKEPSITTIVQNINPRKTSVVLGKEEVNLYGRGYIIDELCGLKFKISSSSFYQINHEQCEKLYSKAIELLDIKKQDVIVDTYSGIGTLSLISSLKAKRVLAVEINKDAIRDAKKNMEINGINNVSFYGADASEYMSELAYDNVHIDGLIMDPTRDGSDERFMNAVLKLKPKRIVYISCNPLTQIRDLKYLSKGYYFKEMYLYDMFPKTNHVESIVLLKRK